MSKLTQDQVVEILSLYQAGERLVSLSSKFNITPSGIIRLLKKHSIKFISPYNKLTNSQKEEAIILYNAGISSSKLAIKYNVTKNYILRLFKSRNVVTYTKSSLAAKNSNLASLYPNLIKEWHPTKNILKPDQFSTGSEKKAWWVCVEGHEWESVIKHRTISNSKCPYCVGQKVSSENSLLYNYPEIASQLHTSKNGNLRLENLTQGSNRSVWWICKEGHEFSNTVCNRTKNGNNCPFCCFTHTRLEKFIEEKLGLQKFNKPILINAGYRPDLQLSEDLYLNVDGLYWHSELNKEKDYHFKMREAYELEDKRIIQFYEDEVYNKWNIVKSIIDNSLNRSSVKLNARQCIIKTIDRHIAKEFYDINHLMGTYQAARHYGLFHDNVLISMMSVRIQGSQMEIARFGSKIDYSIRGGFSKLLSHVIRIHCPKNVVSFCDLRYATGKSYKTLGFQLESISQGWCWSDGVNRFNRLACKADGGKTEKENAMEKNWTRIYDAGQAKYVLELT